MVFATEVDPEASTTVVVRLAAHGSGAVPGRQSQTVEDEFAGWPRPGARGLALCRDTGRAAWAAVPGAMAASAPVASDRATTAANRAFRRVPLPATGTGSARVARRRVTGSRLPIAVPPCGVLVRCTPKGPGEELGVPLRGIGSCWRSERSPARRFSIGRGIAPGCRVRRDEG